MAALSACPLKTSCAWLMGAAPKVLGVLLQTLRLCFFGWMDVMILYKRLGTSEISQQGFES